MNNKTIFKTTENETTTITGADGKKTFTISAICDDDGTFEITITGDSGMQNALQALKRAKQLICQSLF